MDDRLLVVNKFRSLAKSFERFAEKGLTPTSRGVNPAELARYGDIRDEAGALLVHSFKQGYLPTLPGLAGLVDWLDAPPMDKGQCREVVSPGNLFTKFCGNHQIEVTNTGHGCVAAPDAKTTGGIMPTTFPEVLPGVAVAKLESGYPEWEATQDHYAVVCNWLAETVGKPAAAVENCGDDPELVLTPAQLADRLGIPSGDRKKREAIRVRLVAWREKNPGEGWTEDETSTGRQPKFRYRLGSVWDKIKDIKR